MIVLLLNRTDNLFIVLSGSHLFIVYIIISCLAIFKIKVLKIYTIICYLELWKPPRYKCHKSYNNFTLTLMMNYWLTDASFLSLCGQCIYHSITLKKLVFQHKRNLPKLSHIKRLIKSLKNCKVIPTSC